jgi:hypothetical protein
METIRRLFEPTDGHFFFRQKALDHGLLPMVWSSKHPQQTLAAYSLTLPSPEWRGNEFQWFSFSAWEKVPRSGG